MDALKIQTAVIAGYDWGARTADIVAALWPERCKAMVSVSGYLIGSQAANRRRCRRRPSWHGGISIYFATERGRAGYEQIPARFRPADLADSPRRNGASTTPRSIAAPRRSTIPTTSPS